jgi:hypothetical protein
MYACLLTAGLPFAVYDLDIKRRLRLFLQCDQLKEVLLLEAIAVKMMWLDIRSLTKGTDFENNDADCHYPRVLSHRGSRCNLCKS